MRSASPLATPPAKAIDFDWTSAYRLARSGAAPKAALLVLSAFAQNQKL